MKTITFYSYKGGTGRTLAVANTARFLARFGHRVFVLDFDLEAPGLHYKFGLRRRDGEQSLKGLVDLVEFVKLTKSFPELDSYVYPVTDLPSEFRGSIWLMPAGNAPSPEYSQQLSRIELHELFNPSKGISIPDKRNSQEAGEEESSRNIPLAVPLFLELKERIRRFLELKERISERAHASDYLLIDSRTGVTEIGGVAVRLMPDKVVCLIHNNPENLAGARKVLRNVRSAPREEGAGPIEIVTALARIPEMPLAEERELLKCVQDYFNQSVEPSEETLDLMVLPLHSDPDLQVAEALRIGARTTANESILLRDYFKLFRKLGLDECLKPDAKAVLEELAEADRKENIRPLLVGGRRLEGESAQAPIVMRERLQARSSPILKVVCAAYLTGPTYGKFINRVLERLLGSVSIPETEKIPPEEVRYDLLAVHLREGVLDFCADIYYLTENRGHLVEIVQLGWCSTFAAYVRTGSEIHQHLQKDRTSVSATSFGERMIDLISNFKGVAVGVLGDTPAASEVNRRLSPHLEASRLVSKGGEADLLEWLEGKNGEAGVDQRIAICDHVVVKRLNALPAAQTASGRYSSDVTFPFAHKVPVGIVYPREDLEWRKELSRAIAYSLVDLLATDRWNTIAGESSNGESSSIAQDFAAGGIDALSLADLRSSLLLDLSFDEAISWNRIMDAATANAKLHLSSQS